MFLIWGISNLHRALHAGRHMSLSDTTEMLASIEAIFLCVQIDTFMFRIPTHFFLKKIIS